MNYTDTDTDNLNNERKFFPINFLNEIYGFKIKENGDEKMKEENIKEEIEEHNKKLDDMYNDIKIRLKEYYNLDYNRKNIIKKKIEKQLKEIIGFSTSFVDIDAIELNIYIKNYKKIINDIVRIVEIVEDIDYELRSMNLDSDGLSLVFVEK